MKYSKTTFDLLLIISMGLLEIVIEIMETGYLMGKKPEYKWAYQKFKGFDKAKIIHSVHKLKAQGLIERVENKYYLTKRGQLRFSELDIHFSLNLPKHIPWKGFWYLVIFDIPINERKDRDKLRKILTDAGLIKFQQSVYIYPHDFQKEFDKIQSLFPERYLLLVETKSSSLTNLIYKRFCESKVIS